MTHPPKKCDCTIMSVSAESFKRIKALALDLDGTALLPDTAMGERTVTVLKKLAARGMQVILCTGRAIEAAEKYRAAIGAEGPMVYFNGAEVVDMPSGRIISTALVSLEVVDFCIDIARSLNLHFHVFLPPGIIEGRGKWETLVIEKIRPESEAYCRHTKLNPLVRDLKDIVSVPGLRGCVKVMYVCEPEWHDTIRARLNERFGNSVYVARSLPTFLEIMNAGVSKGDGLLTVMKLRGLSAEMVLAAGDEENDLMMFNASGVSAAPANARESVRGRADFIFGSNAEEGLAAFLEEKFF